MTSCHRHLGAIPTFKTLSPALAALLLLCGPHAQASPQVYANTNDNIFSTFTSAQSASSGSVADAESGGEFGIATDGRASASFGLLRAYGQSSTVGWSSSGYSSYSFNTAYFRDDFLIDAPGLTGRPGQVTVRFTIDGTLSYSSSGTVTQYSEDQGYAEAAFSFSSDNGGGGTFAQRLHPNGTTTGTTFLNIEQAFTLNFIYGLALTNVKLEINARTNTYGEWFSFFSSATADLANTATWGGFSEVRDEHGSPVTGYTFSSNSGTNFSQPVPEPGSLSLVLLAGAALGVVRHRRQQSAGKCGA